MAERGVGERTTERGALFFGNRWPTFFLCSLETSNDVLVAEKVPTGLLFDFTTVEQ